MDAAKIRKMIQNVTEKCYKPLSGRLRNSHRKIGKGQVFLQYRQPGTSKINGQMQPQLTSQCRLMPRLRWNIGGKMHTLAPYSIQKRPKAPPPKPQICQESVPTIVFRGSNQGFKGTQICQKFVKKTCSDDCFPGFQSGGPKSVKNLVDKFKIKKKTTSSGQIFNATARGPAH